MNMHGTAAAESRTAAGAGRAGRGCAPRALRQGSLALAALAALLLWPGPARAEQALSLRWNHDKSKDAAAGDDYLLNYTLDLRQDFSEVMSLQESVRYSRQWRDGEQGDTESIDPSIRFAVNNDIFLFDLLGAAGEQRNALTSNRSRRNWEASWASAWEKRFWPRLRTTYGRDFTFDDESPRRQDTDGERASAGVEWDFELFKTYYNVNRNRNNDNVTRNENSSTNHLARFETAGNFFADRLKLGFSHQYTLNDSESSTAVGEGGFALLRQNISQVLTGRDNTPLVTNSGELTSNGQLTDGDLVTPAGPFTDGIDIPPLNIALRLDLREVDRLYLYTENLVTLPAAFAFDLYASQDGIDYQKLSTAVAFTYNPAERRFEFSVGALRHQWLKLVVTSSPIQRVDFTEIEAYDQVDSTDAFVERKDRAESNLSDLVLAYQVSATLGLTYNLSMEYGSYSADRGFERRNQIGQLRWVPVPWLTSSLGMSENWEDADGSPESLNRTYSLRLSAPPLPTVDTNFGLSRSERYEEGSLISTSHTAGLYTSAALYPDLDANLDLTWSSSEQELTGVESRSQGARLNLTARLIPRLTGDFTTDYQNQQGGMESLDNTLTMNWRVSDILSLLAAAGKKWEDWESSQESLLLQTTLAPTQTTQISLNGLYNRSNETTARRYGMSGNWAIGPNLTLQVNGSYAEQREVTDWQIMTQLTARFVSR